MATDGPNLISTVATGTREVCSWAGTGSWKTRLLWDGDDAIFFKLQTSAGPGPERSATTTTTYDRLPSILKAFVHT